MKHKLVEVRRSALHNKGVFAKENIPKDSKIIQYFGDKITKAESLRRQEKQQLKANRNRNTGSVYIFDLNKRFDLDGNISNNIAKYINHHCKPNAEAFNIRGKIWIYAKRKIKKDEELFFNYGFTIDSYEENVCLCGAPSCLGYIVATSERAKLKRLLIKKKKEVIIKKK